MDSYTVLKELIEGSINTSLKLIDWVYTEAKQAKKAYETAEAEEKGNGAIHMGEFIAWKSMYNQLRQFYKKDIRDAGTFYEDL